VSETIQDVEPIQAVAVQPESVQAGLSPLVMAAMNGQLDTDKLAQMLEIQKDWEANEARKAFYAAMAEYKKDPVDVFNDKENKQYESTYTSKGNLVNTVNAALSPHGLSARWSFPKSEGCITVSCILSHSLGHTEEVTLSGPPDDSGRKNPLQQIKSTLTYLEIATFEAITGTASQAGSLDDDGTAAGAPEYITDEQALELHAKLTDHNIQLPAFMKWLGTAVKADTIEEINVKALDTVNRRIDSAIRAKEKASA
jgi:hypothetical protein